MGNVCCKPQKVPKPKRNPESPMKESERALDRTQSIFVKSKVDKFKQQTKIIDEPENHPFNDRKQDVLSDSDSDFEPQLQSVESSAIENSHSRSASRTSQISKSFSASYQNLDNFKTMTHDQYKKGKVLKETQIMKLYHCMHLSTGKLLISKMYEVINLNLFND